MIFIFDCYLIISFDSVNIQPILILCKCFYKKSVIILNILTQRRFFGASRNGLHPTNAMRQVSYRRPAHSYFRYVQLIKTKTQFMIKRFNKLTN